MSTMSEPVLSVTLTVLSYMCLLDLKLTRLVHVFVPNFDVIAFFSLNLPVSWLPEFLSLPESLSTTNLTWSYTV